MYFSDLGRARANAGLQGAFEDPWIQRRQFGGNVLQKRHGTRAPCGSGIF